MTKLRKLIINKYILIFKKILRDNNKTRKITKQYVIIHK